MLKIKIINHQTGDFRETILTLATHQQEWLIGRAANCDLVLDSADVSRVHSRIKAQQGGYAFTDLGSANGSRINNTEVNVNQNHPLQVNDLIQIGDFVLLIEAIDPASSALSPVEPVGGDRLWQGDLAVRCVRITNETADVKTFTFIANDTASPVLFDYKPGQFVTLELEIDGELICRSYSISSTPSRPHTLEITVKRVASPSDHPDAPPGVVSNWLHDHLQVGDTLKVSSPLGKFTCFPEPAPKLLLISAGSGITPMMSMTRWLVDRAIGSDIIFFHAARTPRDIIFRPELEMLAARLPNFRLAVTVSRLEQGYPWFGFTGRFTPAMLQTIAPDFADRTVYVCGPASFMQTAKAILSDQGFPMQNYHEESFGPPPKSSAPPPAPISVLEPIERSPHSPISPDSRPALHFSQSQKEVACDGTASILELAEQEGVKIRSNCRQGVCGACKKRKIAGEVRYELPPDALEAEEQADYVLPCVAYPIDRVVVEA